jgi:hypothetical protein
MNRINRLPLYLPNVGPTLEEGIHDGGVFVVAGMLGVSEEGGGGRREKEG